jgi:hypothetical protein
MGIGNGRLKRVPQPVLIFHTSPQGPLVKATTSQGRDLLSDGLGLPAGRPTFIEPLVLEVLLAAHPDLIAYDLPHSRR